MVHLFLASPFADSARATQFAAVRAALEADSGTDSLLLGNLVLADGSAPLDAVVLRPHSITLLVLLPRGGALSTPALTYGRWQLDGAPLPGTEDFDNPFEQFRQQKVQLDAWLQPRFTPAQANLRFISGLVVFEAPLTFRPDVEAALNDAPPNFQLLAGPADLPRRLRQLASPEIDLTSADLAEWAVELNDFAATASGTTSAMAATPGSAVIARDSAALGHPSPAGPAANPEAASRSEATAAAGSFLGEKARALWGWLGANDVPDDDLPYGYAATLEARNEEKQQLEALRQQMQADVASQLQALEARETERERSIAQLRSELAQAPPVAAEASALVSRLGAETREKAALEAEMAASRAELAARNQELDAKIQQLGQLIGQLSTASALVATPAPEIIATTAPETAAAAPETAAGAAVSTAFPTISSIADAPQTNASVALSSAAPAAGAAATAPASVASSAANPVSAPQKATTPEAASAFRGIASLAPADPAAAPVAAVAAGGAAAVSNPQAPDTSAPASSVPAPAPVIPASLIPTPPSPGTLAPISATPAYPASTAPNTSLEIAQDYPAASVSVAVSTAPGAAAPPKPPTEAAPARSAAALGAVPPASGSVGAAHPAGPSAAARPAGDDAALAARIRRSTPAAAELSAWQQARAWLVRQPRWTLALAGLLVLLLGMWALRRPGSSALVPYQENGRWGYANASGTPVIKAQYAAASPFVEGQAVVQQDGAFGLIDEAGKPLVAPAYDDIHAYHGGYARVRVGEAYTFLEEGGQEFDHFFFNALDFAEGRAAVLDHRGWFYISGPALPDASPIFREAYSFVDGLARVRLPDGYTFITPDFLTDPTKGTKPFGRYELAADFTDGKARVTQNGRSFLINKDGEEVK